MTYGAFGTDVQAVQTRLNGASGTRLPRLTPDGKFGSLTMGRAMEFQYGCIHVEPSQAEQLFNWAGNHDVMVIVLKTTR